MTNLENNDEMMMEASGNSTMLGDEGNEYVSPRVEEVFGEDGDDTITGFLTGNEPGSTLFGNTGNDYIRSRGIGDRVFGGRGDDTIANDNGKAIIYGDRDNDYLLAEDSNATLFGGIFVVPGTREESAEDGNNILVSQGGKNILVGGGGNDNLVGEEGEDTMAGGAGDDSLKGGPNGASYLFGNEGKDKLISTSDDDPDTLFGGRGNDTLDVLGKAEGPALFGGVGGDRISINVNVNNAVIFGDVGPDGRFGGSEGEEKGADYFDIQGGEGHTLAGNAGEDTFALSGSVGQTSIYAGQGNDFITGGTTGAYTGLEVFGDRGDDTISFAGSVTVTKSVFSGDNSNITSGFGKNRIEVRGSGNTLYGAAKDAGSGAGNNFIQAFAVAGGSTTDNVLIGGAGDDYLHAGKSGLGDTLDGGPGGNDTYIFGPGQTIVPDTIGNNTYFGIGADQDKAVTVTASDVIGGAANFFITGDQSNVQSLGTGGIVTTDSSKTQVLTVENATGTTRSGSGADRLTFTNVSGVVDAGAGDDEINISGSVSGSVSAGLGNDIINVNGTGGVVEGGAVLGGEGDDYLFAKAVQAGGLIDGGEGADTISVDSLSGVVKGGGLGKNVFDIDTVFAGAEIFTGAGDENVVLGGVGSTAEDEGKVVITGGAGNNRLGFSYGDEATEDAGSLTADIHIQSNGDASTRNFLQGSPYGGDSLVASAGRDVLYGGESNVVEELGNFNTGSQIAAAGVRIGDGDILQGVGGNNVFLFKSFNETGSVQAEFGSGLFGGGATPGFGMQNYAISVGSNNNATVANVGTDADNTFLSAAFNVDTLTGFQVKDGKEGDRIILDTDGFTRFSAFGSSTGVVTFASNPGSTNSESGFLFGRFGSAGDDANALEFFNNGSNVFDDGAFTGEFVLGGTAATTADFNTAVNSGSVLFDTRTGGLYLGTGGFAELIAVLPTDAIPANPPASLDFEDIFEFQNLETTDIGAPTNISLF